MTEVRAADRAAFLQSKRTECSAIVASRKRKLCELFTVATEQIGLPPNSALSPSTQAESQFLQANDILQDRRFDEYAIPPRRKLPPDVVKRFLAFSASLARERLPTAPAPVNREPPAALPQPDPGFTNGVTLPTPADNPQSLASDNALSPRPPPLGRKNADHRNRDPHTPDSSLSTTVAPSSLPPAARSAPSIPRPNSEAPHVLSARDRKSVV